MKMAVETDSLSDTQLMNLRSLFEDSAGSTTTSGALADLINSLTTGNSQ